VIPLPAIVSRLICYEYLHTFARSHTVEASKSVAIITSEFINKNNNKKRREATELNGEEKYEQLY